MAKDFAKKRPSAKARKQAATSKQAQPKAVKPWRWYGSGVLTGVLLSFLLYLGTLPPSGAGTPIETAQEPQEQAPTPRFDFYTLLPERTMDVEVDPNDIPPQRASLRAASEYYLLQAGSFKQREDADRRRAELLLLGLDPQVEQSDGDNGRWFRVYLGPFESKSKMAKARSMTASQEIDTLLLKRSKP